MAIPVKVCLLPHADGLLLPSYATAGSAGMDLSAAIFEPVTIAPQRRWLIPTGLTAALPERFEMQIRSRSGVALRHGVVVAQGVGTIDSDYRGEVGVILLNTSDTPFVVSRGDRIA